MSTLSRRPSRGSVPRPRFGSPQALAEVTVLGWPGGPEETALRAVAEVYNETAADADKVKLIFFNRDGFWDKLQADLAAGIEGLRHQPARHLRHRPLCALHGRRSSCRPRRRGLFGEKVLATMQFDGKQYGVPTDLSLHFMYYRKDLIDQLLSDDAWKAKYAEIAEEKLGKDAGAEGPRQLDLGRLRGHRALLHQVDQPRQPDPLRHRAADEEPPVQHDGLAVDRRAPTAATGWTTSGNITVDSPAYPHGARALQAPLRRRRHAEGLAHLRIRRGQRGLRLRPGGDHAAVERGLRRPRQPGEDAGRRRQDRHRRAADRTRPGASPTSTASASASTRRREQGRREEVPHLARHARGDRSIYAKAGGSPALADGVAAKIAADRPDLVKLGELSPASTASS